MRAFFINVLTDDSKNKVVMIQGLHRLEPRTVSPVIVVKGHLNTGSAFPKRKQETHKKSSVRLKA